MSYGHFSADGTEYVVTRPDTPRPWYNRFGNPDYGVVISQTGGGWANTGGEFRHQLTYYVPRFDQSGRYLYVRDDEDGEFWSAGFAPVRRKLDRWECRHGLGWTTFRARRRGIEAELTVFVPVRGAVELWLVRLTNLSGRKRKVTAFPFVEWSIDSSGQGVDDLVYAASSDGEYDAANRAVVASRRARLFSFTRAFMAIDRRPDGWDVNRAAFVGGGRTLADPLAVERGRCSGTPATGEITVGAFARSAQLRPGQSAGFAVMIGMADSARERAALVRRFLRGGGARRELRLVRDFWERMGRTVGIRTPDPDFDRYVNRCLVRHVHALGGTPSVRGLSIGFRNYVQDAMGMVFLDPARSRFLLVDSLRYQATSGEATIWFSKCAQATRPPQHVDTKIWPILAAASYLRETGDWGVLRERVPFLDSARKATVLEHLDLAADKAWRDRGQRGLSLVGGGDWNDTLSAMGRRGKGVSVWMSEAMLWSTRELGEIHARLGHARRAGELARRAEEMRSAINRGAWDGHWYRMGYTDSGMPVGTRRAKQGKIFLLPQTWAVLSGATDPARAGELLELVDRRLQTPYGPTLMEKPFTRPDPNLGGITFLVQGMGENGPAYSHVAAFKACADGVAGRGDALYEGLLKLFPYTHDPAVTLNEPFVVPNYYRPPAIPRKFGATHRSWVTSTPNWALKAVIEGLFGLQAQHDGLRVDPAIPRAWKKCSIRRKIRGATYEVEVLNPSRAGRGVREVSLDGRRLPGNTVPWAADGGTHRVQVVLGKSMRAEA